jgi:hypothetical protein
MSLIELAKQFKTDKQYPTHSYIEKYYSKTFESFADRKNLTIVEIGVHKGESLELWNKYFIDANIIGIDINPVNYVPSSKNITVIQGKSSRVDTFDTVQNDDGSHRIHNQIATYNILYPRLNPNGIYIIEDIRNIDESKNSFLSLNKNAIIFDYRKNLNRSDDVIVEIRK